VDSSKNGKGFLDRYADQRRSLAKSQNRTTTANHNKMSQKCLGHVLRVEKYRLLQLILRGIIKVKKGIGGKQMSWLSNIRQWKLVGCSDWQKIESRDYTLHSNLQDAEDRAGHMKNFSEKKLNPINDYYGYYNTTKIIDKFWKICENAFIVVIVYNMFRVIIKYSIVLFKNQVLQMSKFSYEVLFCHFLKYINASQKNFGIIFFHSVINKNTFLNTISFHGSRVIRYAYLPLFYNTL